MPALAVLETLSFLPSGFTKCETVRFWRSGFNARLSSRLDVRTRMVSHCLGSALEYIFSSRVVEDLCSVNPRLD